MLISIKTYANLRSIVGEEVLTLLLHGSPTVGGVLDLLVERYGEQARKNLTGERVVFLLNGRNINTLEGFDSKVREGDMITVLPVLSGG